MEKYRIIRKSENLRMIGIQEMRFQERAAKLIQTIHQFDGVLSRRHIKGLFWAGSSLRPMERRLSKLMQAGYIDWPSEHHRRTKPIPEPICWLGWKGALLLAGRSGIEVVAPTKINENQLRLLQKRLREHGFRWTRKPRWQQLEHDIAVADFRLSVIDAIEKITTLKLEEWIQESSFRSDIDVVDYTIKGIRGEVIHKKRGECPDGYFQILDEVRKNRGEPLKARFLLEIDMATHDNPSFGIEKAAAGAAYIKHESYKNRFGNNAGRWLVVTTGKVRMRNLMRQTLTRVSSDSSLFFFTNFNKLSKGNVLKAPHWWQVGNDYPLPLISDESDKSKDILEWILKRSKKFPLVMLQE